MTATHDNKTLITQALAGMASGDARPFSALLDDAIVWRHMGRGRWDFAVEGRGDLAEKLFRPLFVQFETRLTNRPLRVFADGDTVIVEAEGHGVTRAGKTYNNRYAMFYRLKDGKIIEAREYMDTALADDALEFTFG